MSRVSLRTGNIRPPSGWMGESYGWSELTVVRRGTTYVLRIGAFDCKLTVTRGKFETVYGPTENLKWLQELFEKGTGMTSDRWERAYYRMQSKRIETECGYFV